MKIINRPQSLILVLSGVLCFTASAVSQTPLNWRDFKADEGGFSIKFPGAPKIEAPVVKVGPMTLTRHAYSVMAGDSSFEIDYMDIPAGSDPDAAMAGGISNMINSAIGRGSTVLSNEPVTHGNCTGREVKMTTSNPGTTKRGFIDTLVFASGLRLYTLIYAAPLDTESIRDVGRTFLDSFTVTGGCTSMIAPAEAPPASKSEEVVEGSPDPATGWRVIENSDLGVRVLMPGAARHVIEKQGTAELQLDHHTFLYSKEGSVYSAEVVGEYPAGWHNTPASYQTSIDLTLYALKKTMSTIGFEITPVRDLRLGTNPGREFSMISPSHGFHGRAQIYVTEKRVYVFCAFTRSDNPLTQISQYFSSIRISPR